jgi:hypothetical protein
MGWMLRMGSFKMAILMSADAVLKGTFSDAVAHLGLEQCETGLEAGVALAASRWEGMSKTQRAMVQANAAWLGTMQTAVKKTSIVSEILDPRTRNLIQAPPPLPSPPHPIP